MLYLADNMPLPRKKHIGEIDLSQLVEPRLTEEDAGLLKHGIALFNAREYWEAHEVWEELWKRRHEDSRIFYQGMIQAAAAYHRIVTDPKYTGALNNIEKALAKLELFPARFLGIDVERLRSDLVKAREELQRLGRERIGEFSENLLPNI